MTGLVDNIRNYGSLPTTTIENLRWKERNFGLPSLGGRRGGVMTGLVDNIRNYGSLPTTTIENLRWKDSDKRGLPDGPMSVQGMRDFLREAGLDLGNKADDDAVLEHTARHEAGHCVAAMALNWKVISCDARAGVTKFEFPPIMDQTISERHAQYAAICAAGCEATGSWVSSDRDELANDRYQLRSYVGSDVDFDSARKLAASLLADSEIKRLYGRVVGALIERKVLSTADLAELDE